MSIMSESTIVTNPLSSPFSASGSNMDINEGIWSSYILRAAAVGIFEETTIRFLLCFLQDLRCRKTFVLEWYEG